MDIMDKHFCPSLNGQWLAKKCLITIFCFVVLILHRASCLDNGLARTPPMGFLSWVRFGCNTDCESDPDECIGERMLKIQADAMVQFGYRQAGYEYVVVDDCWLAMERDGQGRLQPDPHRFPSGIKALARHMHARGLKLGLYGDIGRHTCAGFPGSQDHLERDARTLAEWEVDMLKFDGCNTDAEHFASGYPAMARYLNETGRPILYSCEWAIYDRAKGVTPNYSAVAETCNTFRAYGDIYDAYQSIGSVLNWFGDDPGNFSSVVRPGAFADADMITVGSFGLSADEERVQLGMWAMVASPLLLSVDMRRVPPRARRLLQNERVLAISQDALGVPGRMRLKLRDGLLQLWTRPLLPRGSFAVAVWNDVKRGYPLRFSFNLAQVGLLSPGGYNLTEVFDGGWLGALKPSQNFTCYVNPSGIYLLKATVL